MKRDIHYSFAFGLAENLGFSFLLSLHVYIGEEIVLFLYPVKTSD